MTTSSSASAVAANAAAATAAAATAAAATAAAAVTRRFDLTTIGETMLRLSVPVGERLERAHQLDVRPGGAESNVAALLARLGWSTAWCGALPASPLGRLAANHLRMAGVNLDGVVWEAGDRMGLYFVEFATAPRPTQVIYDRAASAAAQLTAAQVRWPHLLDTHVLHLTGITPALAAGCRAIVAEARDRARTAGVAISFDVNFRAKLWSPAAAATTLTPLIEGVDLLFCSAGDAERVFGIRGAPADAIKELASRMQAAVTVMSIGDAGAVAWDGRALHHQPAVPALVVDRPGAGDALAAGVLYGWRAGDLAQGLQLGVMLAALALSQHGDMVITNLAEVQELLAHRGAIVR